ncbi:hypothetical protein PAHAL_6G048000 [Panicum hallii]|uniref:Uncharacterized protein n=1 Tax=Panicum hallii TaxID=206008 RepID=A0A2T8IF66_9POAL|nr:hypothetical protein PAHAL_6G048000 [Panicum hallii]
MRGGLTGGFAALAAEEDWAGAATGAAATRARRRGPGHSRARAPHWRAGGAAPRRVHGRPRPREGARGPAAPRSGHAPPPPREGARGPAAPRRPHALAGLVSARAAAAPWCGGAATGMQTPPHQC